MITILLVLVIVGVCLYLIENYVPMSPPIKTVLRVIVVLFLVIWLLRVFGITDLPTPRLRRHDSGNTRQRSRAIWG